MNSNNLKWPAGELDFINKPLLMGILNVTPDSFSDGGKFIDPEKAIQHALQMQSDGAAIIDIGPESSRPASLPVPPDQQIKRVLPIIKKLSQSLKIPISIDTYDPRVARAAIDAGASIINDITACENNNMTALAVEKNVPVILMHMQGTPQTMQQNPHYENVTAEVKSFLLERARKCQNAGIDKNMIIIDPGIGFGKTFQHNIELLKNLDTFTTTGYRVLLGTSRKGFLGKITEKNTPNDRLSATLATTAYAASKDIDIVRVHDIAQNTDIIKVINSIRL